MNNPLDTTFFDDAVKFALEAHHGTERRGKGYPYLIHLMEAATIVATITNDQEMLAAAILHDTVEDTDVTLEQIRERFSDRVAQLVHLETAPMDSTMTWRERKTAQVKQLEAATYDSKVVALGDKLSNMRGIAWDYRQIGDKVWSIFHAQNGKKDVEWYYRSLAEAMKELSDTLAYQEFVRLLEETFSDRPVNR